MNKILVTTDLSTNSKAGLRFALQLASQGDFELVFFHCFQALIPTTIQRDRLEDALQEQVKDHLQKLERFVASVIKPTKIKPGKYRCVIVEDLSPEKAILEYTQQHGVKFICISTRGAGQILKIIGTNTSKIIVKSPVPVLVVPHTYRLRPLKKALYASDLENIDRELPMVSAFAKSIGAKVDMAHFFHQASIKLEAKTLTAMWRKKYPSLDQVVLKAFDLDASFAEQLNKLVKKVKPGIAVFFTHPNQTWYSKLFSANRSESFSFVTKVPMLVYRKEAI
ncbi:MAG: universal stress protein [Saprospiraceae bacterium]